MFFCPNCKNIYDITKNMPQLGGDELVDLIEQIGGVDQFSDIIIRILENDVITDNDIKNLSLKNLRKSLSFKQLPIREKDLVVNKIRDLLPKNKKQIIDRHSDEKVKNFAFFQCHNCGFIEKIKPRTLIFSRSAKTKAIDVQNKDMLFSDIVNHTRKYICPNKKCESHSDPNKKEAIFYRKNNSYQIRYICKTCKTKF